MTGNKLIEVLSQLDKSKIDNYDEMPTYLEDNEGDLKDYGCIGRVMEYISDFIKNHSYEEITRLFERYPELKERDFSTRTGMLYISYMIKNIGSNQRKNKEKINKLKKERRIKEGK